jgi:hypothetical protein
MTAFTPALIPLSLIITARIAKLSSWIILEYNNTLSEVAANVNEHRSDQAGLRGQRISMFFLSAGFSGFVSMICI